MVMFIISIILIITQTSSRLLLMSSAARVYLHIDIHKYEYTCILVYLHTCI